MRATVKQKQFAGQVAWERDLKIVQWPTTSRGVSALINRMIREVDPLPVTEWQIDAINERLERAVVEVEHFDAAAVFAVAGLEEGEMPTNRADANKMLRELDNLLGKAEFNALQSAESLDAFVAKRDDDEGSNRKSAAAAATVADDDLPI